MVFFSKFQLGFFTIIYILYYFHFISSFSIISFYFNDGFFLRVSAWFFTIILTSFCFTDFWFSFKLRFLSLFWLVFYCRNIFFYLFSLHCLSNYFHFLLITRTTIFTVGQDNFGNKILMLGCIAVSSFKSKSTLQNL